MDITVVGCGYVGSVTAACFAAAGHFVRGYDADPLRAGALQLGQVPFQEPGLAELIRDGLRAGRLSFTDEPTCAMAHADFVFLCVGTPMTPGGGADVSDLQGALVSIAPYLQPGTVVVTKSTVPIGGGDWICTQLEECGAAPDWGGAVVANPEFLREGSAVADFRSPDRIVLGGDDRSVEAVWALYQPVFRIGRPPGGGPDLFRMDRVSAEMVKYSANAALATKISFANEIAALCELTGADAAKVLPAVGADARIGGAFLGPGLGWGGSCLPKDSAALVATGREYGYEALLLQAAREVNDRQVAVVAGKLLRRLKVLKGRRIAILGLSYKPGTDDLRCSQALALASRLVEAGALVTAFDPAVKDVEETVAIRVETDPYEAARGADAAVVATAWPEFRLINPERLGDVMRGRILVDPSRMLEENCFVVAGFEILAVGRDE